MNYIQYGREFFHGNSRRWGTNGLFMNGEVEQRIALFGNELSADSLTFVVNSKALVGDGTGYAFLLDSDMRPLQTSDGKFLVTRQIYTDWRNFVPGASLDLYNNPGGTMIGRFYVQDVKRINRKAVQFTCTDCVGILDGMDDHGGGVYTGETVSQICAEIFAGSGLTYTVGEDVGAVQCYGRLARDNRRVNMGKLLVATGATLSEKNGVVQVTYLGAGAPSTMYQRNVYMHGGSVTNKDRATGVEVTEHAFYELATDADAVLFDNTAEVTPAASQLVIFQEACHDLTVTGTLTLEESNANYAIVSGVGTLSGKVYTHTKRQISKSTGVVSNKVKVEKIENNELIGYHNSDYVAQRMANWYKVELGVGMEALDPTGALMPGSYVNLVDPFGQARTGWTRHKSFAIGNKTRATWDVAIDWTPGPWGSNLDAWELITESKTWTVPAGVTSLRIVLGQGGKGGGGGNDGGSGRSCRDPGDGGAAGAAGTPGKVNVVDITVTPGQTFQVTIGAPGAGGDPNEDGSDGGETTFGSYSSADGVVPEQGFLNQFTGDVYAVAGEAGIPGAKGGKPSTNQWEYGESVTADGQTWTGGRGTRPETSSSGTYSYSGAGGGGAAYGNNGENASSAQNAGRGADATDRPDLPSPGLGSGGIGGNGGGGGGQGGTRNNICWSGSDAAGGSGSKGFDGGSGWCMLLYKAAA